METEKLAIVGNDVKINLEEHANRMFEKKKDTNNVNFGND